MLTVPNSPQTVIYIYKAMVYFNDKQKQNYNGTVNITEFMLHPLKNLASNPTCQKVLHLQLLMTGSTDP